MLISIIASTFREYQTGALQNAVASVLRQTYKNWELIIVGDCAPDAEEINQFLTKIDDKRIKFINLIKRAGTASPGTIPKIEAVKLAKGELLCFLDADNLHFPNHLTHCARAFKNDPKLDLVYGDTVVKFYPTLVGVKKKECQSQPRLKSGRKIRLHNLQSPISNRPARHASLGEAGRQLPITNYFSFTWTKPDWTPKRQKLLMTSNFLDMSEPVFTRKAYFDAGGLNPSHHASDWLLWKAMLTAGHSNFKHLDHLGLIYHTNSLTHHLQYFMLMMMQKIGLTYHSERLKWMQKNIKARFKKKHT